MASPTPARSSRTRSTDSKDDEPKVYSYIRFSTPEQAMGDSERRQVENAQKWAKAKGHTFDESLQADRGVSGWSGAHRKKGNLGKFLARVEAGEVPRGSILVVEEIRRLTREGIFVSLREIFEKLWDAGIAIQTLQPEFTFTREKCEADLATSVTLTILLQIAKEESRQKSEWGKANWEQKRKLAREKGIILTKRCPDWLYVGKDDKFKVHKGAGATIRLIYRLFNKGFRPVRIAKYLNKKAAWSPPPKKKKNGRPGETVEGWHSSYIKKILRSRAVIGELEMRGRDPIAKYYPHLFDKYPGLYEAVQLRRERSAGTNNGGQTGKASNLLQKLVHCAYCNGPMHFDNKGGGLTYLYCYNEAEGKTHCKAPRIRYSEVETLVLTNCPRLKPVQVLPSQNEQDALCKSLLKRVQGGEALVIRSERQIKNLNDSLELEDDSEQRAELRTRVLARRKELALLKEQLVKDQKELRKAEHSVKSFVNWQASFTMLCQSLQARKKDENGKDVFANVDLRLRLNSHLKDFIDRIELFTRGHKSEYDPDANDGDRFAEWMEEGFREHFANFPQPRDKAFIRYVVGRRMSKEGRFVRVCFANGVKIDLVPEGSLATGLSLGHNEKDAKLFEVISPDISLLSQEFAAKKKKSP